MIDEARLRQLAAFTGEPSASIYMPTHVRGPEVEQDPIRLKNRLTVVDDALGSRGWSPQQRDRYLAEARSLIEDRSFWRHQDRGLGVLIDPDGRTSMFRLRNGTTEHATVGKGYHIRPLLASVHEDETPVLVLTEGAVRMNVLRGSELEPVDVHLPESMEDVNWFVDRERSSQEHVTGRGGSHVRHGHDPQERAGADRDRFLRAVDDALPAWTAGRPLVVLGVDDLVSRFENMSDRKVLRVPHGGVADVDDVAAIRQRVEPLVVDLRERAEQATVDAAATAIRAGSGTGDLEAALTATGTGRVARLVLFDGAQPRWGRFDPSELDIHTSREPESDDVDLLNTLVVQAVNTRAEIQLVGRRIEGHDFVAMFRF